MKALCACIFSCMAVEAGCPAPTAALLGHPRLELCGMDVRPALRFSLRPPVMMLRLLCRYEDQLGAPFITNRIRKTSPVRIPAETC